MRLRTKIAWLVVSLAIYVTGVGVAARFPEHGSPWVVLGSASLFVYFSYILPSRKSRRPSGNARPTSPRQVAMTPHEARHHPLYDRDVD